MRSVVVVFPASMCAMMPMLRIRSSGVVLGIAFLYSAKTRGDRGARERAGLAPPSSGDVNPSMQDPLQQGPEVVGLTVHPGAWPRGQPTLTTDSEQMPGWLPPSGACLPSS